MKVIETTKPDHLRTETANITNITCSYAPTNQVFMRGFLFASGVMCAGCMFSALYIIIHHISSWIAG